MQSYANQVLYKQFLNKFYKKEYTEQFNKVGQSVSPNTKVKDRRDPIKV